jgi:hypothetical protein
MAVRIVALLIPLAITLPQLQTSSPSAAAPPAQATTHALPASPPDWSFDTRRGADAALTRVVLESPALDAVRTIGSAPGGDTVALAPPQPAARKAAPRHAAAKPVRPASSAKAATDTSAPMRPATRHAKAPPLHAGCEPFAHCAPVVMGKITPVIRKSL